MAIFNIQRYICDICGLHFDSAESLARFNIPGEKYSDGHQYVRDLNPVDVCIECSGIFLGRYVDSLSDTERRKFIQIITRVSEARKSEMQKERLDLKQKQQAYALKKKKQPRKKDSSVDDCMKKDTCEVDDCI
jgi:hypothetical protein